MKKSLIFWFAAATCAAWILVGCEQGTGGDGAAGAPGAIYLSGSQTTAGIQAAIDSGAPLVFAGVTQTYTSGNGTVTIPAGRGVKLVGDDAYTVADNAAAFLILGDASSVTGTGVIDAQANGTVIADKAVLDGSVTGNGKLAYTAIGAGGTLTYTGTTAALKGNVTIDDGEDGTIDGSNLSGKTLFVVGNLTVADEVTVTALNAVGNVTASGVITGAVNATGKVTFTTAAQSALTGLTSGSVDSAVAITTTSNGAIDVDGELKTTGASSTVTVNGTGTLTVGSLNLAGNLAAGSGGVTVKGASVLGGDVTRGDGAVTFGGDVTLTDGKTITLTGTAKLNLKGGASIKVGANTVLSASGDVEITPTTGAVLTATSATKTIAVSTAGIAFTGALLVSGELKATDKPITATQATGILAIAPGGKITTTGADTAGAILLGTGASNGVTLTGAGSWTAGGAAVYLTQTGTDAAAIGTSGAATLTASGTPTITVLAGSSVANVLTLGAGVTIDVAGTAAKVGAVVLTGAGSNVGTLKLVDGTSKVITGNTGGTAYSTGVKQSVAAAVTTINDTVIVTVNANKIVSVAGGGAGNGTIAGGGSGTISIDGATETTDADS